MAPEQRLQGSQRDIVNGCLFVPRLVHRFLPPGLSAKYVPFDRQLELAAGYRVSCWLLGFAAGDFSDYFGS